ncbi:coproporphyrinogen-III oxidase family protein [Tumebacillus algifaecis]|nr:coproporphyrinogen-III oxidase family protein [Tumebacillus algifaecis]
MSDSGAKELPFHALPKMWVYLYPYLKRSDLSVEHVRQFLQTPAPQRGKKTLYMHIPFCDTICTFCPFVRSTNYQDKLQPYVDALIKELKLIASTPRIQGVALDAIFVGGGTPSVLSAEQIHMIGETVHSHFKLKNGFEWTFEVEAKSATEDKLKAMHEQGVNRISFGVQTFDPKFRKMFNLTASHDEIKRTRELAGKYFKGFNMDLLYQLPGQTWEEIQADLQHALELNTTSIDAYPLDYTITSKGFLQSIKNERIPKPPNAYEKVAQQEAVTQFLVEHGYKQEFIYTFIRQDAEHKRFMFGETLYGHYEDECIGAGLSAFSYQAGMVYRNFDTVENYLRAVEENGLSVEIVNDYHAREKGLIYFPKRMSIDLDDIDRHELDARYYELLDQFEAKGLIKREGNRLLLTREGQPWYMNMMIEMLPERTREVHDRISSQLNERADFTFDDELIVFT